MTIDYDPPTKKTEAGVFAAQATALKLNVVCCELGVEPFSGPLGTWVVDDPESICYGEAVTEVLLDVETVLGGDLTPLGGNSKLISTLNECPQT